jgi:hypothetical protein
MSDNRPTDKDWEEAEARAQVLGKLPTQLTRDNVDKITGQLGHSNINAVDDAAWEQAVAREAVIRRLAQSRDERNRKGKRTIDASAERVHRLSKRPVHRLNGNFAGERGDFGRIHP